MAGFDAGLYATAFEEVVGQARKVEQLNQPGWYGPEVEVLDEMGKVALLCYVGLPRGCGDTLRLYSVVFSFELLSHTDIDPGQRQMA